MTTQSPQWDESRAAWIAHVLTEAFGMIEVMIHTDGRSSAPTARQLSAVDCIVHLPKSALARIPEQARLYAEEYMMEDDFEELTDADFRVRFSTGIIPRLRNTSDHYYFLIGASDIDDEHGIACLFKNHETCRICHTDAAYGNYDWDDTSQLDCILRS